MSDNPYSAILDLTKSEQPQDNVMIGEVISADPLVIQIGELQIDRDNLMLNNNIGTLTVGDRLGFLKTNNDQTFIAFGNLTNNEESGNSSGTLDYNDLVNKPSIESVKLVGDLSLEDVGVDRINENEINELF